MGLWPAVPRERGEGELCISPPLASPGFSLMGANALSAEAAASAWGVCSLMAFLTEKEGWLGGQTHSPDETERQGLALSGTPPFLRHLGAV